MSNSPLVSYTRISPNKHSPRNHKIDTISIHCVVGQLSVESLGNVFSKESKQASCNYGIGSDGRIGMYVEESDRSWCTSSAANDHRAITIEVASDTKHPYKVKSVVYESLINLLADICERNGIEELLWKGDKTLIGQVDKQNMTVHRWFKNKACPGDYLYNLHGDIANKVNAKLRQEVTYDSVKVGNVYQFIGNKQYSSASAKSSKSAGTGNVKVTKKYLRSSKHPIHVRSIDDKGRYTSEVYGWVDLSDIKESVDKSYKIKVLTSSLNIRRGPSTTYPVVGVIRDKGVYTIVEELDGWGKLGSKVGWISLKYTDRV